MEKVRRNWKYQNFFQFLPLVSFVLCSSIAIFLQLGLHPGMHVCFILTCLHTSGSIPALTCACSGDVCESETVAKDD